MRYALNFNYGGTGSNPFPSPPGDGGWPVVTSRREVAAYLRRTDRAEGQCLATEAGGSWVDAYDADAWDGTGYGDPVLRATLGVRLGVHLTNW